MEAALIQRVVDVYVISKVPYRNGNENGKPEGEREKVCGYVCDPRHTGRAEVSSCPSF